MDKKDESENMRTEGKNTDKSAGNRKERKNRKLYSVICDKKNVIAE